MATFYGAKFRLGDMVSSDVGQTGIVRAIFATFEGEPRYAIENEGSLDFICEARLSLRSDTALAA